MKKDILNNLSKVEVSVKTLRRGLWFREHFKKN